MAANIQRKCGNCNTWNGNVDYCLNCNHPISIKIQEKIEKAKKAEIAAQQPKDKLDIIAERYKNHRFILVRVLYHVFNSIFMVFMGIGSAIAYFIAWTAG
ncbi:MAG: hypothetical protein AB8B72_03355 [Crocinitomicaceae bacterium]